MSTTSRTARGKLANQADINTVNVVELGMNITGKGLDGEYREGEYTGMVVRINEGHVFPYQIQWANGPFMVSVGWVQLGWINS